METGTGPRNFTISISSIQPACSRGFEAETATLLDEFRALSDVAARLAERSAAVRQDWLDAHADDCPDAVAALSGAALLDELDLWVQRADLLAAPRRTTYHAPDVAAVVIGSPLPGYFVG